MIAVGGKIGTKWKCFSAFLRTTKNFHWLRSPCTESITHSVKSADATSIFGAAGAMLSTFQPLQVHHFGGGVFKMDTYKKVQIYSQVENATVIFLPPLSVFCAYFSPHCYHQHVLILTSWHFFCQQSNALWMRQENNHVWLAELWIKNWTVYDFSILFFFCLGINFSLKVENNIRNRKTGLHVKIEKILENLGRLAATDLCLDHQNVSTNFMNHLCFVAVIILHLKKKKKIVTGLKVKNLS